jgi:hypothetical protein
MKGGLFTKQLNLPLMSIVLAILVVLFAGWLLFTLGKREGFQEGTTTGSVSRSSEPPVKSFGQKTKPKPIA